VRRTVEQAAADGLINSTVNEVTVDGVNFCSRIKRCVD
jgi:hypothetical protein